MCSEHSSHFNAGADRRWSNDAYFIRVRIVPKFHDRIGDLLVAYPQDSIDAVLVYYEHSVRYRTISNLQISLVFSVIQWTYK